jgi:AmiR/NasT family two-component response regulator
VPQPSFTPSPDGVHPTVDPAGIPANGTELEALRREITGLRAALVSRATIDQARGVLVARDKFSPDGAFDLLVRWSQDRNVKVRTIAETLVTMAQHGPDGPQVDPSLGRWLTEQLSDGAPDR